MVSIQHAKAPAVRKITSSYLLLSKSAYLGSKDSSPVAVIGELNKIMKLKKRLKSAASKKQPITIEDAKEKRPPTAPLSILAGKKSYIDLKNEFGKHLPRLSSLDTRQTALKELGIVIESNKTPEGLRVFLSILTEYKRP